MGATMRALARDKKGDLPGLPLEMMVIAVVMVVVIPSVYSISNHYRDQRIEEMLQDELSKFKRAAEEVWRSEPGNVRRVELSISSLSRVEYVRCGGRMPSEIRYRLTGGKEGSLELDVNVMNNDGGASEIELPLDGTVITLKRSTAYELGIVVSVGDLN